MKTYLPYALAGLICPIAAYPVSRGISIPLAIFLVAAIAGASGLVRLDRSNAIQATRVWLAAMVYCLGVLVSQVALFVRYYLTFGYRDEKLNVGIAITQLEFVIIAATGSAAIGLAIALRRRLRSSDGRR